MQWTQTRIWKGNTEIYKKLTYRCIDANPNQRPTAKELYELFDFWDNSILGASDKEENFGYRGKEINAIFEKADKEIPNISTSYEKDPDAVYTSRAFTFSNLPKPTNSSIYLNDKENYEDNSFII